MRVRLSAGACEGTCSKCGDGPQLVLPFTLVVDDHAGDAESLCQDCLFNNEGVSVEIPMLPLAPGPAPRRKALRRNKRTSHEQEIDVCEELGARTQPNSGAMASAKGDGRKKGELRIETKFTSAESFGLKLQELWKIEAECGPKEKPVFVVDYLDEGTRKLRSRYAIVPFDDYKELLHDAGEHRRLERTG